MPNIAGVLKGEISRLARKEVREEMHALKKASVQYRKDIAEMKRRISELQRRIGPLQKQVLKGAPSRATQGETSGARFTAKGLRSQRQRLGLSAADYGKLVGVTGQTIYSWSTRSPGRADSRWRKLPLCAAWAKETPNPVSHSWPPELGTSRNSQARRLWAEQNSRSSSKRRMTVAAHGFCCLERERGLTRHVTNGYTAST